MDDDTSPGRPPTTEERPDQQMLWVDGVGGYLVCFGPEATLGHPGGDSAESRPDIGLLADVRSRHATVRRVDGGWLLTPGGEVSIDGRPLEGPTLLTDGDELSLGDSVRVRFRLPHSLSGTAVLTVESGQRIVSSIGAPAADAVILMAQSCVLGPKSHSHVRCPRWTEDVILFRGAEGLLCRSEGELLVDSVRQSGPVLIRAGSRVEGQDFALSVEGVAEA